MFHSGLTFFGQPPSNRAAIHEEIFNIAYYGNGAKEREKKIYDKANKDTSSNIARPTFTKS